MINVIVMILKEDQENHKDHLCIGKIEFKRSGDLLIVNHSL